MFANCGQFCPGTGWAYIERPSFFKEFAERLARGARALVLGDPLNPNARSKPLIGQAHGAKALNFDRSTADQKARAVTEGGVHSVEFYTELRNICLKL